MKSLAKKCLVAPTWVNNYVKKKKKTLRNKTIVNTYYKTISPFHRKIEIIRVVDKKTNLLITIINFH